MESACRLGAIFPDHRPVNHNCQQIARPRAALPLSERTRVPYIDDSSCDNDLPFLLCDSDPVGYTGTRPTISVHGHLTGLPKSTGHPSARVCRKAKSDDTVVLPRRHQRFSAEPIAAMSAVQKPFRLSFSKGQRPTQNASAPPELVLSVDLWLDLHVSDWHRMWQGYLSQMWRSNPKLIVPTQVHLAHQTRELY